MHPNKICPIVSLNAYNNYPHIISYLMYYMVVAYDWACFSILSFQVSMILFIALCTFECLGKYVQAYVKDYTIGGIWEKLLGHSNQHFGKLPQESILGTLYSKQTYLHTLHKINGWILGYLTAIL